MEASCAENLIGSSTDYTDYTDYRTLEQEQQAGAGKPGSRGSRQKQEHAKTNISSSLHLLTAPAPGSVICVICVIGGWL